jgi:hypothetical protein
MLVYLKGKRITDVKMLHYLEEKPVKKQLSIHSSLLVLICIVMRILF